MEISYLLYLALGKLIIYFGMKFPYFQESKFEFVKQLFSCDECLGFWVYIFLSALTGIYTLPINLQFKYNFLNVVITGMFSSFVVHLISLGWKSKFEIVIIE